MANHTKKREQKMFGTHEEGGGEVEPSLGHFNYQDSHLTEKKSIYIYLIYNRS